MVVKKRCKQERFSNWLLKFQASAYACKPIIFFNFEAQSSSFKQINK